MSLPTEILDSIFGYLQSDTTTLKTCSRSHPTLCQLVDRYLYANVIIENSSVSVEGDEFLEALRNRPHVANYVRTLEIRFETLFAVPKAFLEKISSILPKLFMLRRIELASVRCYTTTASWHEMPEKFRLAFLNCLRLPSVMDLRIAYIEFPLSMLSHCKHINYLSLQGWKDDRTPAGDNACLPTIDSLHLQRCYPDSLSTIISWMQSRSLSSLRFSETLFGGPFDLLPQILKSCSHSLTSLDVDIIDKYRSIYNFSDSTVTHYAEGIPIQLSIFSNLRHLTIRAGLNYIREEPGFTQRGFSSPIFAVTKVVQGASSLERLTLVFHFYILVDQYRYSRHHITDILCGPLHSLLLQSASTIESIVLRVNTPEGTSFISPDVIASMFADHTDLKGFVEDGKLTITTVIEDVSSLG